MKRIFSVGVFTVFAILSAASLASAAETAAPGSAVDYTKAIVVGVQHSGCSTWSWPWGRSAPVWAWETA